MSDPVCYFQDQDDLMCSNSGYPLLSTEQMSQLLLSIHYDLSRDYETFHAAW